MASLDPFPSQPLCARPAPPHVSVHGVRCRHVLAQVCGPAWARARCRKGEQASPLGKRRKSQGHLTRQGHRSVSPTSHLLLPPPPLVPELNSNGIALQWPHTGLRQRSHLSRQGDPFPPFFPLFPQMSGFRLGNRTWSPELSCPLGVSKIALHLALALCM